MYGRKLIVVYFCGLDNQTFGGKIEIISLPVNICFGREIKKTHKGSYMSAQILLELLIELGKETKCKACRAFYLFCATS